MQLLTDVQEVSRIGYGFMASKALFAALDMEVFTHLSNNPLGFDELRERTGAAPHPLRTLLSACASLGLIAEEDGRFVNSPAATNFLARGSPQYFGDYFRYQIDRQMYPALQQLGEVLAGRPTTPLYAMMVSPADAQLFSDAQHVGSAGPAHLLARRVDASRWNSLLDVAGGTGAFSIALCRRNPKLRATLLDFPTVTPLAERYARDAGLQNHISTLPGEALSTAWGGPYDAVLMSYLLSAVEVDQHAPLLAKAYQALGPGGALLLHDFMLTGSEPGPTHAALWFVMNSISGPGVASFTVADLAARVADAGFGAMGSFELLPGITRVVTAEKPAV